MSTAPTSARRGRAPAREDPEDKKVIEEGATRSPVHHIFSRALQMDTTFKYVA